MDNIRIVKQIGVLAENDDGTRKEFNIVSINGGPPPVSYTHLTLPTTELV